MSNVMYIDNMIKSFNNEGDDDLYFPVSLQEFDVHYGGSNFASADNFQAIVREDTGQVLSVPSKDYKLIRNDEIVPQFEDMLRRSSLDMTDMYTKTSLVDDGGAFVKSYHFPAHTIEPRVGDLTELTIRLKGSYNSRWANLYELLGNRLACTNGMVTAQTFTKVYGRHTKNFDVSRFVDKLTVTAELFLKNTEIWTQYAQVKINDKQVAELFKELDMPERFTKEILQQFYREISESGHYTIWELFNALTHWSSHGKLKGNAQRAVTQEHREKRVRQIMGSAPILRMVA